MFQDLSYSKLLHRFPHLKVCGTQVIQAINELIKVFSDGGKLITFGNGGSACDAEHICGELQKGFLNERALTKEQKEVFFATDSELPQNLQGGLPAISLSTQFATQSAFANDVDPEFCFAQQVYVLAQPNDAVLGISTSGNSKNVVHALKVAKAMGVFSIALTGQKPSLCEEFASVTIKAPAEMVHEIQELHLPIYHAICLELENHFFKS